MVKKKLFTKAKKKKAVTTSTVKRIVKSQIEGNIRGEKIYKFKRTAPMVNVSSNSATEIFTALTFKLSDLPDYSEFVNLYDQYCIDKVVLYFLNQSANNYTYTNQARGYMLIVPDYDDSTTPVSMNELLQYDNLRIKGDLKSFRMSIKPKCAKLVYNGVSSGYSASTGFIDMAYPSVPHYGVKWGLSQVQTTNNNYYQLFITYHLRFRGVR